MSNVNDNNIDDLMRRASEKYPLRTDSADWDRLVGALERDPSLIQPPVDENTGGRRRRRFLWLLLLLPLGGLGYLYYTTRHASGHPAIAVAPSRGASGQTDRQQSVNMPDSAGVKDHTQGKEGGVGNAGGGGNGGNDGVTGSDGVAGNDGNNGNSGVGRSSGIGGKNANGVNIVNKEKSGNNGNAGSNGGNGSKASKGRKVNTGNDGLIGHSGNEMRDENVGANGIGGNTGNSVSKGSNLYIQRARINGAGLADIKAKPLPSSLSDTATNKKAAAKTKKTKNKQSYFYAGVLAAPDMSMVKFQSVKGVGFTGGVLLGYAINHKWAVETGLYLDRKKYYTQGEYFSRKNIPLPSSYNILTVDGSCNMLEIPLNVRYNIGSGVGKVNWFATAGMSSYLMSREAYNYAYEWIGIYGNSFYTYKQPSRYWFSVINLSLGYEHTLGRIGELRVEPYLRIPTSGIGTGVLPVMSTGVNIGFTHRFR